MTTQESYIILGLNQNASIEDIKSAYRKLAKQYHPDKTNGDEFLAEMFKKIKAAYDLLVYIKSSNTNQQDNENLNSRQNEYQKVIFNPNLEKWIDNHHKVIDYINNCKDSLSYIKTISSKKYLSILNIAKLIGIAFLITIFFYPYRTERIKLQTTKINSSVWQTNTNANLYATPNKYNSPLAQLKTGQSIDSLGTTKYFLKVNVQTSEGILTGYILKNQLKN